MWESEAAGGGGGRGGAERRRSELHLNPEQLSPRQPPHEEWPSQRDSYSPDSAGYQSNALISQVLYYGPEALDSRQEQLEARTRAIMSA